MTSWWFPSVCLSVRTPLSFFVLTIRFSKFVFVWKVWNQRPNFYTFCPSVCLFIRPFMHPSVPFNFTFLPSDFKNYFFVWKELHQRPFFYIFCPSVRPFICPSVCPNPLKFRSYRPIFKIIFLFARYNIRDLFLYSLSVCPHPFHLPF